MMSKLAVVLALAAAALAVYLRGPAPQPAPAGAPEGTRAPPPPFEARRVESTFEAPEKGEGVGARVRRSVGSGQLRNLDPFLMLDLFSVEPPSGFFGHPHRGQETLTYLLQGSIGHEDSTGRSGVVYEGGCQFMSAARGVMHVELPASHLLLDEGDPRGPPAGVDAAGIPRMARGFQLWVSLGADDKLKAPAYEDRGTEDVPKSDRDGVWAAVVAGTAQGVTAPAVPTRTPIMFVHYRLRPGAHLRERVPAGWNAFAFVFGGALDFGGGPVRANHAAVFATARGDGVEATAGADGAELVLLAGQPLGEPIVQHGPFVMNSRREIEQAFADFRSASNGFEGAAGFEADLERRFRAKFM